MIDHIFGRAPQRFYPVLLLGVAGLWFLGLEPAVGQSSVSISEDAIDEIVVTTVRRREESLQDVPLAITVLCGNELERIVATDIVEVGKMTPNVTLEVSRGTNTTLTAFIRGVGQQDPVAGFDVPTLGLQGNVTAFYGPPRTVTATAEYRY